MILAFLEILLAFFAPGRTMGDAPEQWINDELSYRELTEQTLIITHYFPWGGNSLVVFTTPGHAVLIDTPYDGVATDILLEWLQKDFGIKEVTAIVTGFHQDNLGGIESLLQKGAQVWGITLTDSLLRRDSASFKREIMESVRDHGDKKYYNRYSNIIFRTPNQLVNLHAGESKSIEIDGMTFEIYYPGPSHTADNSVVSIPDQNLLFGGCMIRAKEHRQPGNVAYADMDKWPGSVEKVLEKYRHAAIVVPGHGLAGDISLIEHTIKILNEWNVNHAVE